MSDEVSKEEIAELAQLEAAATPDWELNEHPETSEYAANVFGWLSRENRVIRSVFVAQNHGGRDLGIANARLAVKARNALPRLLATLAASQKRVGELEARAARCDIIEARIRERIESEVQTGRSIGGAAAFQCQAAIDALNDVLDEEEIAAAAKAGEERHA